MDHMIKQPPSLEEAQRRGSQYMGSQYIGNGGY